MYATSLDKQKKGNLYVYKFATGNRTPECQPPATSVTKRIIPSSVWGSLRRSKSKSKPNIGNQEKEKEEVGKGMNERERERERKSVSSVEGILMSLAKVDKVDMEERKSVSNDGVKEKGKGKGFPFLEEKIEGGRKSFSHVEGSVAYVGKFVEKGRKSTGAKLENDMVSAIALLQVKVLVTDMPGFMQIQAFQCARKTFDSLEKFSARHMAYNLKKVIKDATQGSESGKTISHFVLDALICIDHEKFFLSQLQSRGFLRSCLMSISNFSHQDVRRTVQALQRTCTLEAELALMLRVSHKYGKAGAQVLSSMGTLEHLASCKALYMPLKGSLRRMETRFGRELPANVDKQQVIVAPVLRLVLSLTSLVDASDYFEVKNKIVREAIEFVKAHPSLFDRALQENISEADELMMELINLVVGVLSKVWPYEENDEYGFVQGLFRMMCDLFSQDSEPISAVSSGLSPLHKRRLELKKFHVGFRLSSYLHFQVTKKSLRLQVSDGQSAYHKSGGGQQPTLALLCHFLNTVTNSVERAAEEKSLLLSKIQDINELSRQEVDGIIDTFTEKTRVSSSDNTNARRYIAMVEMCQIVGDRDQLVTLLLLLCGKYRYI